MAFCFASFKLIYFKLTEWIFRMTNMSNRSRATATQEKR